MNAYSKRINALKKLKMHNDGEDHNSQETLQTAGQSSANTIERSNTVFDLQESLYAGELYTGDMSEKGRNMVNKLKLVVEKKALAATR